jgi:hypothetical protein
MKKRIVGPLHSEKKVSRHPIGAIIFGFVMALLICQLVLGAQEPHMIVMGGWINPIDSANLISGAGSNLVNTYQSDAGATTLSIVGGEKDQAWQIYINRSEMNWPSNFVLYVRRTGPGDGTEGSTVRGGLSFQVVNSAKTLLCSGTGKVHHIPLQYQLSGVSLTTNPGNYNLGIVYTLIP